jgi:hypothetical protein
MPGPFDDLIAIAEDRAGGTATYHLLLRGGRSPDYGEAYYDYPIFSSPDRAAVAEKEFQLRRWLERVVPRRPC